MSISAAQVKELRDRTGAGMMDCKKALTEANGDAAAAERLLKEWGLAGVEKRAGRATNEGRVFLKETADKIAIIEIACETDFVSRNENFIAHGQKVADGQIRHTNANVFSFDEGTDVGIDEGTPVSDAYGERGNKFTGKIHKVTVAVR